MGKTRKKKAREKLAGREKGKRKGEGCPRSPQLPPVLFSCLRFLNSADPTISEPGTGYVNMIYQVTNTERTSWNIKKSKEKSQSQSQSSVPKQFKTNEFQNGTFLRPSSYYKYRGDNLQHSVVNNNETQSRNSRAVALSTHARLRFNSSMSLLLGAFDLVYLRNDTKNSSSRPWTY